MVLAKFNSHTEGDADTRRGDATEDADTRREDAEGDADTRRGDAAGDADTRRRGWGKERGRDRRAIRQKQRKNNLM
jgi:hypothetical protein